MLIHNQCCIPLFRPCSNWMRWGGGCGQKFHQQKEFLLQPGCQEAVSLIPGVEFPPRNKCVIQMSTSPQLLSCVYYTCLGGVPTAEDVKRAIDDLAELHEGRSKWKSRRWKVWFYEERAYCQRCNGKYLPNHLLKHQCLVLLRTQMCSHSRKAIEGNL